MDSKANAIKFSLIAAYSSHSLAIIFKKIFIVDFIF